MEDLNISQIVSDKLPIKHLEENIQQKATNAQNNTGSDSWVKDMVNSVQVGYIGQGVKQEIQKPSIEYQVPITEGYDLVGGEWLSKFPTYKQGRDNAEYAAQNQSTWDKVSNGLLKAGANLATTVAGNTVGLVIGVAEGARQGSLNAVFDNSFSNMLADYNEKLNYKLPNYVTKDEKDENLFGKLGTANFWANDVAGAFSFTLGTAVSEAIWATATGGALNAAKWGVKGARIANLGRWGKAALGVEHAASGLAGYKGLVASTTQKMFSTAALEMKTAVAASNTAKWLNTARFLATTSGNEAGIEALHYKREAREDFYNNFAKYNGREPSEEEIADFESKITNASNAVFATNMAILAPSNMAMFGSMFNITSPFKGVSKAMNKSLFGIGVEKTIGEAGETVFKGLQATGKQKAGQVAYALIKPLATEGLWEEGLQGVASHTAKNWISTAYDPKYNNKTMALADATYKAFAEQYGTKEGWTEIGIGAIVGIGGSLVAGGGKLQEVKEFAQAQKYQEEYVAKGLNVYGNGSPLATDAIVQRMMMNTRLISASERIKEAIDKGDDITAVLASQDFTVGEIQFMKSMGENPKDLISKYKTALDTVKEEDYKEKGITDIEGYKKDVINGYSALIDSYERASDFADAVLGETRILGQDIATQELKFALTRDIVAGQTASVAMDGLLQDMGKIIGADSVKTLQVQTELQRLGKNKQAQVRRLNTNINQAEIEVKLLSDELQNLQVSKDETKGERLQTVQRKLTESSNKLNLLKEERENIAQEVSQESKRRRSIENTRIDQIDLLTDYISGEDLANIDLKLQKIEDSIKGYKGVNHQLYYELLDTKKQYLSAKSNFLAYQDSVDAIVNGKLKLEFAKAEGFLGKIINSKAPIDDFTGKYLTTMYENYQKSLGESYAEADLQSFISDEDYAAFKETGEISEENLSQLVAAVRDKELLTDREKEIFKAKEFEINRRLAPNPNKPDLTVKTEIVPEDLTEAEIIRKQIETAFNEDYPMLTVDVDELIKEQPSEAEIEKYKDLFSRKGTLSDKELEVFNQLQDRMQKWFMAQSLPVGNSSIADLVELLVQLETQSDKEETVDEINSEELMGDTTESKDARAVNREDILQNLNGNASVKKDKGDLHFAGIKLKTFTDKLLLPGIKNVTIRTVDKKGNLTKAKDLTPQLLKENEKIAKTEITIGEIKLTIGARGNIVISETDYRKVEDLLNLHYYDSKSGKWSWADVYERFEDGTTIKKVSEYEVNTVSEYLYDSTVGSSVNTFVDMKTEWNQGLILKSLQDIDDNGEISEETKKEILNTLEITVRNERGNISTLKAATDSISEDNFAYLRKKYTDEFITTLEREQALATLPKSLDLQAELLVKDMYLGTPNLQLDENLEPIEQAITERGVEKVITQGYVSENGKFFADKTIDTEQVSNLFVTNLIKVNPNKKIPVVVLQKGNYKFAFPITMVKTVEDKSDLLEEIMTTTETPIEAVKKINALMISLGSNTRLSVLTNEKLEEIRTELETHTTFKSADELADSKYDKRNLITDATTKVDLADEVISSPKMTVDFKTLTLGTITENETNAIALRQSISNDLKAIEKIVSGSKEIPDQGRFVKAFDDTHIENNETDIMNRKDVNFIKKLFFTPEGNLISVTGKGVEAIGKDRLLKLREDLQLLQFYENQIKTIKDKTTISNLTCN